MTRRRPSFRLRPSGYGGQAGVAVFGLAVVLAIAIASQTVMGQRGGGAGGGAPGTKPLVPLTAASIVRDVQSYVGVNASMMAPVEAIISKTVFTVDQDRAKSTGQDVLVIAPAMTESPALNAYVTVQGEVFKFSPEEVVTRARGYTLDMPADAIEKFRGKPAIVATAVITGALIDLAKKPIPPMSADDVVLSGHMKAINSAFTAMRGGLDKPDAALLKEQIATLKKGFTDTEAFFKTKAIADAAKWSAEALQAVSGMEQSAAAGKFDDLKAPVGALQGTCTACHTARRERMDDGTYRLKIGG